MDKFEEKELIKKRTFTKNTWFDWCDWLINYIPEPIKKTMDGVKDQIMSLFIRIIVNQNMSKLCIQVERNNQKKAIKSVRNIFKLKKENE